MLRRYSEKETATAPLLPPKPSTPVATLAVATSPMNAWRPQGTQIQRLFFFGLAPWGTLQTCQLQHRTTPHTVIDSPHDSRRLSAGRCSQVSNNRQAYASMAGSKARTQPICPPLTTPPATVTLDAD